MRRKNSSNFEPGTQVAFIPGYASGNINHPDVQFGFVVDGSGMLTQCRFWSKVHPNRFIWVRTYVFDWHLRKVNIRPQSEVDAMLELVKAGDA